MNEPLKPPAKTPPPPQQLLPPTEYLRQITENTRVIKNILIAIVVTSAVLFVLGLCLEVMAATGINL